MVFHYKINVNKNLTGIIYISSHNKEFFFMKVGIRFATLQKEKKTILVGLFKQPSYTCIVQMFVFSFIYIVNLLTIVYKYSAFVMLHILYALNKKMS